DNATNRRVLALQTARWGMDSRATESPAEALRWLAQGERFDLAILDMHMPEMDGVDLARRIRANHASLPLVLFSSLGRREVGDAESLFNAYLSKPIHQSALFDTLVSLLAHESVAARPADNAGANRQICTLFEPGRRPRIVAMTANAMQGDQEMCLAAGMDDYLTKPIRVDRLVEALHNVPARQDR